jgi:hypothetical protein
MLCEFLDLLPDDTRVLVEMLFRITDVQFNNENAGLSRILRQISIAMQQIHSFAAARECLQLLPFPNFKAIISLLWNRCTCPAICIVSISQTLLSCELLSDVTHNQQITLLLVRLSPLGVVLSAEGRRLWDEFRHHVMINAERSLSSHPAAVLAEQCAFRLQRAISETRTVVREIAADLHVTVETAMMIDLLVRLDEPRLCTSFSIDFFPVPIVGIDQTVCAGSEDEDSRVNMVHRTRRQLCQDTELDFLRRFGDGELPTQ